MKTAAKAAGGQAMIFDLTRAVFAAAVAFASVSFEDKRLLWWWLLIPIMESGSAIIKVRKDDK